MNDLNYVLLGGNVVRKPVLHIINENASVCNFTIAVNRSYFDKRKNEWISVPCFFPIETWGNVAEACAKYLEKGRGVRIVGRLNQSSWQGPDNIYRDRFNIISEHVEFQPIKKTEEPRIVAPEGENIQNVDSAETKEQIENDVMIMDQDGQDGEEQEVQPIPEDNSQDN